MEGVQGSRTENMPRALRMLIKTRNHLMLGNEGLCVNLVIFLYISCLEFLALFQSSEFIQTEVNEIDYRQMNELH